MVQYAGRLHRFHRSKFEVCIYDYVDARVPMLARMFDKRLRAYRAMGYQIDGMTGRVVDDDSDKVENE